MAEIIHIPVAVVADFMFDVFRGLGVPEEDAHICADVLIASDLQGIETHGVSRLMYYYDRIKAGVQATRTEIEVVSDTETTAVVDGHNGMGHVIAYRSMRLAMDKARRYGLGAVAVRNSTHFGIAGYYPTLATKEGMIGLTVTNARPAIAPTFGTEPMLGTNPIAFAAPSDMPFPVLFRRRDVDHATGQDRSGCPRRKADTGRLGDRPRGESADRSGSDPDRSGGGNSCPAAAGRRRRADGRLQGLRPGDDGRGTCQHRCAVGCS